MRGQETKSNNLEVRINKTYSKTRKNVWINEMIDHFLNYESSEL